MQAARGKKRRYANEKRPEMLLHTSGRRLKHGNRRYPVIVFYT